MTPSVFTPIVLLAGLLASRTQSIYWQMVFCLFGCAAALELTAIGGAVILPSVLFLPFLFARAWAENYGQRYSRRVPLAAFWLACAVFYGVLSAYLMPRLFAGQIEGVLMDRSGDGPTGIVPLRPVSGNITQSGYAIGEVILFCSMHALLTRPGRLTHFRDAVLLLASLDCGAAILNLAEFHLGLPSILDYVRTAYAVFGSYEIPGLGLRIHGTFSEASAFSSFSLTLFAFSFSLWLHRVRSFYTGTLWVLLLTFLIMSTSTTAYVGLGTYLVMLGFLLTYRGYKRGAVPRIGLLVAGMLMFIVILGSVFVLETEIASRIEAYLQVTVFEKAESDSGVLRATWNRYAWSNFIESYGLGVGIGTVRASSFALVLLSNIGAIGTLCYLAFLKRVLAGSSSPDHEHAPVSEAARQALLASLAAGLVSAATFDLGIAFYSFAAAACAGAFETAPIAQTQPQETAFSARPPLSAHPYA